MHLALINRTMWLKTGWTGKHTTYVRIDWLKKDVNDPHLSILKKNDAWEYKLEWRFSELEWLFESLEFRTIGEWKEARRAFSLTLSDIEDWEKVYVELQCWFNSIGKNIINSLASQTSLWKISISVYKNAKWFASVTVRNNNNRTEWALSIDEQRSLTTAVKHPKTGETISNDYSDLEQKLEELVKKFSTKNEQDMNNPVDDDLPF